MWKLCMHYWISLASQTLLWDERVWSSSHHCLLPNTPRISWCVNWLSDKWRCGSCLFWLVTWGAGVAKEILVFQNMSQFMFTLTSLGAMLLSTQTQKPNGNNFDQTISSCVRFWSVRLLLNCTLPSFPHPLTNKRLKPRTGLSHAHLFLALSLDTYCHYWCVALHQLPVPIHLQVFALTSHWTIKAPNHDREQEVEENHKNTCKRLNGVSLASQTHFRKRGKGLVNCVYKPCPTRMQLAGWRNQISNNALLNYLLQSKHAPWKLFSKYFYGCCSSGKDVLALFRCFQDCYYYSNNDVMCHVTKYCNLIGPHCTVRRDKACTVVSR